MVRRRRGRRRDGLAGHAGLELGELVRGRVGIRREVLHYVLPSRRRPRHCAPTGSGRAVAPEASGRSSRAAPRALVSCSSPRRASATQASWRVDLQWSRTGRGAASGGGRGERMRPAKAARQQLPPLSLELATCWTLAAAAGRGEAAPPRRGFGLRSSEGTPGNGGAGAAPPPLFPSLPLPAIPLPLSAYICSPPAPLGLHVPARIQLKPTNRPLGPSF